VPIRAVRDIPIIAVAGALKKRAFKNRVAVASKADEVVQTKLKKTDKKSAGKRKIKKKSRSNPTGRSDDNVKKSEHAALNRAKKGRRKRGKTINSVYLGNNKFGVNRAARSLLSR